MAGENDFVTLKIWTFDLALIITQNRHLFESLSSKKLWWNKENCAPPKCYKITMKICVFSWKSGKRWQFCVLVSIKVDGHVFRDKKSFIYFLDPILGTPCISVSPQTGIFWFHCQWFWAPHGSQILEICVIMLVEFVYYGYCSRGPCLVIIRGNTTWHGRCCWTWSKWSGVLTACPRIGRKTRGTPITTRWENFFTFERKIFQSIFRWILLTLK